MKQYGKLENGILTRAPKIAEWHGHIVNNPSGEKLHELGYLPITYTEPPTWAEDGKHYESDWEQTESEILQTWYLADNPVCPEPEQPMEERLSEMEQRQEVTDTAVQDLILTIMGGA